jgi:hypothetical protein
MAFRGAGGTRGGSDNCVDEWGHLDPARIADSTVGGTGVGVEAP